MIIKINEILNNINSRYRASIITLSVAIYLLLCDCHYAECRYAECRGTIGACTIKVFVTVINFLS